MSENLPENTNPTEGRDERGRFLPGMRHGPGMPAGYKCGRARALATLDSLFEEEGTQARLKAALREAFEKNPVKFFRQILMPLMPQNVKLELQQSGPMVWKGLVEQMDEAARNEVLEGEVVEVPDDPA